MSNYPFRRLRAELEQLIRSLPSESRLPPEPELARQLGVSRSTLREAMRVFEGQGLIRRRQGSGTFVTSNVPVIESNIDVLESIEAMAQRSGQPYSVRDLMVQNVSADAQQAALFHLPLGAALTRVERVIYIQERPISYLVDLLPANILRPDDLDQSFGGSVLELLWKRDDLTLSHSQAEISAVGATPEVARSLQIQRNDVLLLFQESLYTQDNRLVDCAWSYFLPGFFKFRVTQRLARQ